MFALNLLLSFLALLPLITDVVHAAPPSIAKHTSNALQAESPNHIQATDVIPARENHLNGQPDTTSKNPHLPDIWDLRDGLETVQHSYDLKRHPPSSPHAARMLHGRFLHITDLHPDEFYVKNAAVSQFCHRKKPRKDPERAGYYGVPFR
jgi:hypothetical protein